jgi:hypothetical protein
MGKAISYILGNWKKLTRFLEDARLPPDNNRSEAALRIVALNMSRHHTRAPAPTITERHAGARALGVASAPMVRQLLDLGGE